MANSFLRPHREFMTFKARQSEMVSSIFELDIYGYSWRNINSFLQENIYDPIPILMNFEYVVL